MISKQRKQELIQEHAPTLWKSFQMLDKSEEMAKEYFKSKYGSFWKLKVSKKKFHTKHINIATQLQIKEYEY